MTTISAAGMIALLGLPNAGKSTLINRLAGKGKKISAVTHKAQTTRMIVHGVADHSGRHFVIADTPGLFAPKIDRALYQAAWAAADQADILLLVSDAAKFTPETYAQMAARVQEWNKPFIITLNKIDIASEKKVFEQAAFWQDMIADAPVLKISARRGTGIALLKERLACMMQNPRPIEVQKMTKNVLAAEITREKILLYIHDELPWRSEVKTVSVKKMGLSLRITQEILIPQQRQKSIFIGKGGQKLKMIGSAARKDMEKAFGIKVHLFLTVQASR